MQIQDQMPDTTMQSSLTTRPATIEDAGDIALLVNQAYRGESSRQGWTTEADILDGLRTNTDDVRSLIQAQHSTILVARSLQDQTIVGSVHIERDENEASIGMFVIDPTLQAQGLGKQLLAAAEHYAWEHWQIQKTCMWVITKRTELIAFYERRGYVKTGVEREFPVNPAMWQPKVAGLKLARLEKLLLVGWLVSEV